MTRKAPAPEGDRTARCICIAFKPDKADIPADVPRYSGYPLSLVFKLLVARIEMLAGR